MDDVNTKDFKGCVAWFVVFLFGLCAIPINIITWAYISSCFYYWYMPYVMVSFPQFKFSSFVALNIIVGSMGLPYFLHTVVELGNKTNKEIPTPSKVSIDLIVKVFIVPWMLLLIGYIMFKIITCFISPAV